MPPSSNEAIVFVLDIGISVSEILQSKKSFFEESRDCLVRILERKIFSHPNDLIALVLMGSEDTNNNIGRRHISIGVDLCNPTWDFIATVKQKIHTTKHSADWIEALQVAIDYLNNALTKKVASKKIVLLTDLKSSASNESVSEIIDQFESSAIKLTVIGPDIFIDDKESELTEKSQLQNEEILKQFFHNKDTDIYSFEEVKSQMLFYKKKATNPNPWNADLRIGKSISIPISAFAKIRDDKTIVQWKKGFKNPDTKSYNPTETLSRRKNYHKQDDNAVEVDELDIINGFLYGQRIIPFTDIDQNMLYKSGPRCLTLYGFTNSSNINWNNLSGDGLSYVVARKGDENAKVALETLVTLMEELELVGIVRRVYNNDNAPHMNVLFPVKEEDYKCLSMAALSFKEDYRYMSFPPLQKKLYNKEQEQAIDGLIDSMDLDEINDGEELFSIENSTNPTLQHFFDTLAYRAVNPNEPLPQIRPEVKQLMEVQSLLSERINEPLKKINECFVLTNKEKPKGSKYWVDKKLKNEDISTDESDKIKVDPDQINALSVMASQVTYIGTAEPVKDFKTLLSNGEPIESVAEQMKEVIEKLVLFAFGSNYSKPVSALTVFREELTSLNPNFYNDWLLKLKEVLFERSKGDFFQLIVDNKLGLISKSENDQSKTSDGEADIFCRTVSKLASNNMDIDTAELDDLFDD